MFAEVKTETGSGSIPAGRLPMTELVARHSYLRDLSDKMIGEQDALARTVSAGQGRFAPDAMPAELSALADKLLAEIDELEQEIRILGYQMELIEDVIFETPPRDPAEALAKLRFLSGQMQDGYEFSPDYFANVMEECSELLDHGAVQGCESLMAFHH
ncbi:hypothetical protein [Thioclava sp. GXIMD4216]|uniref:hypothetical protein n=1 Tax=Thioclava sp. GXIMD4216 TaxID=3131929 RepID=UPI0030CBAE6A